MRVISVCFACFLTNKRDCTVLPSYISGISAFTALEVINHTDYQNSHHGVFNLARAANRAAIVSIGYDNHIFNIAEAGATRNRLAIPNRQ